MSYLRTRIKVCGITSVDDAEMAVQAGVDAIGCIHYPPSPRHIEIEQIADIGRHLPPFITFVALLVDPDFSLVKRIYTQTSIDCFQFHGSESAQWLRQVAYPYYKKVSVSEDISFDQLVDMYPQSRALLVDTPTQVGELPGGTGQSFDWKFTQRNSHTALILAGGLQPNNISDALAQVQPYAVDVNSGVEKSLGKKDKDALIRFVDQVRVFDATRSC